MHMLSSLFMQDALMPFVRSSINAGQVALPVAIAMGSWGRANALLDTQARVAQIQCLGDSQGRSEQVMHITT